MRKLHRLRRLLGVSTVLLIFFAAAPYALALEKQKAVVKEVLSGDSVRLEGGKVLKYIGVRSPALQSAIPLVRTYGENALAFNQALVLGKTVQIEWDSQIRDNLGNLVGYVYLEDGTFVNLEVLKAGHGKSKIVPPNAKYADAFQQAEFSAARDKKGLWQEEPQNPYLKRNDIQFVGEKNTKIYYLPNSPELDHIAQGNLVEFRSRIEAKAAGYRACSTCKRNSEDPLSEDAY